MRPKEEFKIYVPDVEEKSDSKAKFLNPKNWFKNVRPYKPLEAQAHKAKKAKKRKARISHDSELKKLLRSVGGFVTGLFLISVYSAIIIFVKNYSIWYCLITTVTLAAFVSLGMGFSITIRSIILLMLPQFFSNEGRIFILIAIFSLAVQGPFGNMLENFRRCAGTVSCGAELALNQTADLMQRAKEPLLSALEKIKKMGLKAKVVADRVSKFFKSIFDAIKHIARTLRNVWYWISQIGQVCNHEMGTPYRKCIKVFEDAKSNCMKAIPFLYFLCYIVDIFKPLCGIAKILLLFCIIPSYVAKHIRARASEPVMNILKRVKKEFEFNMTSKHIFKVHVNSSKSLSQVAFDIMEDIELRLAPFREFLELFGYFATFIIIYMYIQALLYRRKYLLDDYFDNIYITRSFIEIDVMRAQLGKATVLPLLDCESYNYIQPFSVFMSRKELMSYTFTIFNVFRHFLLILLLILMDYIIFWILDMVRYFMQGEIIARAPVTVAVAINGTGYSSEIYSNVVSAFDALQKGNISIISKKCRLNPSEPDYNGYLIIGLMYGMAFFIAIFGTYITRLQRVVCASYFPGREQERIIFLYNNIITKRMSLTTALMKAIRRKSADEGHTNIFLILAAKFPLFRWLANCFGVEQKYCMACGKVYKGSMAEMFVSCSTPGCKGLYCRQCYQLMDNICTICMAPLTYQGNQEEEIDSSDEEKVKLWISAMKAMKVEETAKRRRLRTLLKNRIKQVIRRRRTDNTLLLTLIEKPGKLNKQGNSAREESTTSGFETSEAESKSQASELDYSYQDKSEPSEGESPESHDPENLFQTKVEREYVSMVQLRKAFHMRTKETVPESPAAPESGHLDHPECPAPSESESTERPESGLPSSELDYSYQDKSEPSEGGIPESHDPQNLFQTKVEREYVSMVQLRKAFHMRTKETVPESPAAPESGHLDHPECPAPSESESTERPEPEWPTTSESENLDYPEPEWPVPSEPECPPFSKCWCGFRKPDKVPSKPNL
ncbi:DC-STAMP domain-containing protein 2 [Rhinatrema bivittatum]|uniref:DC-STAMP domain-containing protein 2 n=1 Tax=Rhinatrema bivittatum TaxID=194408 RepID=UPI0011265F1F|nr:DC-STAMP domain-containing protein 2 [Rhinatrema bivittatum]